MPSQPPTEGRIVQYTPRNDTGKVTYPAVITHVHDAERVNLNVQDDGMFPLHEADKKPVDVRHNPSGELIGQSFEAKPGTWRWPPRVPS